jgi:xanthine dehydrogenase accessory factor
MTHNIGHDARFLRVLAGTSIEYIGLLGPVARRERLLSKLGKAAQPLTHRVFGPVSLDSGARPPEEIALSIIAEMVAHLRSRHGRSSLSQAVPVDDAAAVD